MRTSTDRLTALDQLMLQASKVWPQDIGALAILDGADLLEPSGRLRIEAVREALGSKLHLVPRFRQVVHVPRRGLGGPLWVDAPVFDLAEHVRVIALPAPGEEAQLLVAAEQLRRRRLDRARPLWEMWFLTGLPERLEPATGDVRIEGVLVECDADGRASSCTAVRVEVA